MLDNLLAPSMTAPHGQGRAEGVTDWSRPDARGSMITPSINPREQNYFPDSSMRLSPKSTEHIRRVHELVALYRCRFKPNLSDASVMGTLHSAASVIQIHFRYLRHLREAGLRQPAADPSPAAAGPY